MPVNTKRVERRELRFESYDDLLREADRLATAPQLKSLGNWTLGQAFAHVSGGMRVALDGTQLKAPFFIRWIAKLFLKRILRGPMPAGHTAPPEVQKEFIPDESISTADGLAQLQTYVSRMRQEPQRHPHPAFGPLSREQWDQLTLRHAELHFSFHDVA